MAYKGYARHKGFVVGASSSADFATLAKAVEETTYGGVIYLEPGYHGDGSKLPPLNQNVTITSFDEASANDVVIVDHQFDFNTDVTFSNFTWLTTSSATASIHYERTLTVLNCNLQRTLTSPKIFDDRSSNGDALFHNCIISEQSSIFSDPFFSKGAASTSTLTFSNCSRPNTTEHTAALGLNEIRDGLLIIKDSYLPFNFDLLSFGRLLMTNSSIGIPIADQNALRISFLAQCSVNTSIIQSGDQDTIRVDGSDVIITNTRVIRNSANESDQVILGAGTLSAAGVTFGIPREVDPALTVVPIYVFPRDIP